MTAPDTGDYVNVGKAARWVGFSERQVRTWCKQGILEGAYQFQHNGTWLIPARSLEKFRPRPEWLTADTAENT